MRIWIYTAHIKITRTLMADGQQLDYLSNSKSQKVKYIDIATYKFVFFWLHILENSKTSEVIELE